MKLHFVSFLLFFSVQMALAQEEKPLRSATEAEFVGYWRIMLIPDEKSNLRVRNKDTGLADPCQVLIHRQDGFWFNITVSNGAGEEESRRRCPALTRKDVDLYLAAARAPKRFKWKKLTPSVFEIQDEITKDKRYWVADFTTRDASLPNFFDLKQGDLVMNMAIPAPDGRVVTAWRMVLRPIPSMSSSNEERNESVVRP